MSLINRIKNLKNRFIPGSKTAGDKDASNSQTSKINSDPITMQALADILNAPVDRPIVLETTALGAAWLAGPYAGVWPDQAGFSALWRRDRRFVPKMSTEQRKSKLRGWQRAVAATLQHAATE